MKQQQAQSLISAIQNEKGEILTYPIEINNAFHLFYQKLYATQDSWDRGEFHNFLSRTTLPALTELARERLGACSFLTCWHRDFLLFFRMRSSLRSHVDIKGIVSGQEEHKLLLYVDDILLLSSNPESAPYCIEI